MRIEKTSVLAAALVLLAAGVSFAQVIDLDAPEKKGVPEIWQKADEAAVKKAEEAARKDACLRLVEAVYRLPVSTYRDVLDMMIRNEQVNQELIRELGKSVAVGAERLEDGTVRVTAATTPAQVVEILKKAYDKVDWDKAEDDAVIRAVAQQTKADTQILATGESALAGTLGEKRLPVRRAARLKAAKEIATQVVQMVVGQQEQLKRVRDFALEFPEVSKKLALGMTSTTVQKEDWKDTGVEMRAELNVIRIAEFIRNAQPVYDRRSRWEGWWFGAIVEAAKDMIYSAQVKAGPGDPVPDGAPLVLERKAVDEALKVPVKEE